ncbi:hypothetical protein [Natrinema caseinilyticum]|uniref:hypothetical protein n=1 Tax=Natrinema caseinilyticum TaxID=2961570 RepID=UPI0020C383D6|nr:hypothetical protein [Natrinema caseinilyticum]
MFEIRDRVRERLAVRDLAPIAILGGALWLFGFEDTEIGTVLFAIVFVPLAVDWLSDLVTVDIGPGSAEFLLGALAATAGVRQLRNGDGLIGVAFVATGCWLCLDGIDRRRRESDDASSAGTGDATKGEVHLAGLHSRWLLEALREADRPLTRSEICDRTGLMEDDFERLLEIHGESGPIERVGTGYTVDENEIGVGAVARSISKRLLRPVPLFRTPG